MVAKLLLRFSLTMPSEPAKKVRTCEMKCWSVVKSLFQSVASAAKVNFFSGPEGSFGLRVHPPEAVVLDGEEDETMGIHLEKWLTSKVCPRRLLRH